MLRIYMSCFMLYVGVFYLKHGVPAIINSFIQNHVVYHHYCRGWLVLHSAIGAYVAKGRVYLLLY